MATEWNVNFPSLIQNTTGTSVVYSGSINQSGMLYMAILPEASGAPNAAQIIAHTDASGNALASGFYDSKEVAASGTAVLLSGYGLTSETDYTAYFIASGYVDGLMASVHDTNFTTPDVTAPSWSGIYPTLGTIYGTSGNFNLAINDAGSGYVLVLASGAAAPAAAAIKASGTGVALLANAARSLTVTGLISETAYTAYAVAQDEVPNLQSSGWLIGSFTTSDITAPSWAANYPAVTAVTTSTATMNLKLNDAGSGYFVIIPSGAATPSTAQIIAGQNAAGSSVGTGLYGSGTLVANTVKTLNITNLQYSTYYTYCVTAKDDAGNSTAAVASGSFRAGVPSPGAPSNFYSAKNVSERRRRGMVTGTISLR